MNVGDEIDVLQLEHQTNLFNLENMRICTSDDSKINVNEMKITALDCGDIDLSLKNEQNEVLAVLKITIMPNCNNFENDDEQTGGESEQSGETGDEETNNSGETGEQTDENDEQNDDESNEDENNEEENNDNSENVDETNEEDNNITKTLGFTFEGNIYYFGEYFCEKAFCSIIITKINVENFTEYSYELIEDFEIYKVSILKTSEGLQIEYDEGLEFSIIIYDNSNHDDFIIINFPLIV